MNFHICSSCHLLFCKAHCVLKVKQGCSKRTNPEESSRCALLNGGRVGRNSWEAREEGVHYCRVAHKEVANFPKCLERPRRNSLLIVHRFAFYMVFFSFFFSFCLVVWCQKCYFCLMYHVSLCMLSWECGCVCLQGSFLPLRRWHAWCAWVFVSVCAYIYLLLGQCFVFITLLTHCKDKPVGNGIAFGFSHFFFLNFGESLGLFMNARIIGTSYYCCPWRCFFNAPKWTAFFCKRPCISKWKSSFSLYSHFFLNIFLNTFVEL